MIHLQGGHCESPMFTALHRIEGSQIEGHAQEKRVRPRAYSEVPRLTPWSKWGDPLVLSASKTVFVGKRMELWRVPKAGCPNEND
jgi:hypothetical protein